jgi:arginyl-tRNA synthetase
MQTSLEIAVKKGFKEIYDVDIESVEFQATRKDFEGDITIVVFAFLRYVKGNPEVIGAKIGEYLKENVDEIADFNVVKGFLNLVISDDFFLSNFHSIFKTHFGKSSFFVKT